MIMIILCQVCIVAQRFGYARKNGDKALLGRLVVGKGMAWWDSRVPRYASPWHYVAFRFFLVVNPNHMAIAGSSDAIIWPLGCPSGRKKEIVSPIG